MITCNGINYFDACFYDKPTVFKKIANVRQEIFVFCAFVDVCAKQCYLVIVTMTVSFSLFFCVP